MKYAAAFSSFAGSRTKPPLTTIGCAGAAGACAERPARSGMVPRTRPAAPASASSTASTIDTGMRFTTPMIPHREFGARCEPFGIATQNTLIRATATVESNSEVCTVRLISQVPATGSDTTAEV